MNLNTPRPNNRFFQSLSAVDYELFRPHLKTVTLRHGDVLFDAGRTIDRLFFPTSAVICLVVPFSTGETVEAGMVGCGGVAGSSAVLDGDTALHRAIMHIPGTAITLDVHTARQIVADSERLRGTFFRHEQILLVEAQQTAACNVRHEVQARVARWLLRSCDLAGGIDQVPVTHEFIAAMLGVRRTTITVTSKDLEMSGFIRHVRGRLIIRNPEGLQSCACDCYAAIRKQEERLLGETGALLADDDSVAQSIMRL
jgi:CRP-like cAMP-binding protein